MTWIIYAFQICMVRFRLDLIGGTKGMILDSMQVTIVGSYHKIVT